MLAERLLRSGANLPVKKQSEWRAAQACRLEQARERVQPILASFQPQAVKDN